MSLDKARKRCDSLQAENILLKLSLEAMGTSFMKSKSEQFKPSQSMTDNADHIRQELENTKLKYQQLQQAFNAA